MSVTRPRVRRHRRGTSDLLLVPQRRRHGQRIISTTTGHLNRHRHGTGNTMNIITLPTVRGTQSTFSTTRVRVIRPMLTTNRHRGRHIKQHRPYGIHMMTTHQYYAITTTSRRGITCLPLPSRPSSLLYIKRRHVTNGTNRSHTTTIRPNRQIVLKMTTTFRHLFGSQNRVLIIPSINRLQMKRRQHHRRAIAMTLPRQRRAIHYRRSKHKSIIRL